MYVLNVGKITRTNHQSMAHTTSAVIASISSHIHTNTVFVAIPLLGALNKVHTCVIRVGIGWKMMKWEANHGFPFSRFQKALVFVGGGSADVAHPCQFADV